MANELQLAESHGRCEGDTQHLKHVLDHGFVRLVSYMQPVPEKIQQWNPDDKGGGFVDNAIGRQREDGWSGDLEIVRNARVSYDADWRTGKDEGKDEKLVNYMYSHKHSSPFEAMVFTFEVKAPIFVFRQWHRHRTWSYNEVSARYSQMEEEFYVPLPEYLGAADPANKQGRVFLSPVDGKPIEGFVPPNVDFVPKDKIAKQVYIKEREISLSESIRNTCQNAFALYQGLLAEGVPREIARSVLPVNTYSRMFATVDLHNLFHFLRLRLDSHAQYEIRVYAEALLQLIRPVCPLATKAFITDFTSKQS